MSRNPRIAWTNAFPGRGGFTPRYGTTIASRQLGLTHLLRVRFSTDGGQRSISEGGKSIKSTLVSFGSEFRWREADWKVFLAVKREPSKSRPFIVTAVIFTFR